MIRFTKDAVKLKLLANMILILWSGALLAACSGGGGVSPMTSPPPVFTPGPHPQQNFVDFASQSGLRQTSLAFVLDPSGVTTARFVQDTGLDDRSYLSIDGGSFELTSSVTIDGLQVFANTAGPSNVFQTFDDVFTNWESNNRRNLFQKILILKPGEQGIGLSHTTLAYWVDAVAVRPTVGTIIWGVPLNAQAIPDTGAASYEGLMRGFMTGDDQTWELHADFNATVDFGSGALSGGFTNGTRIDVTRPDGSFFSSHVTDQELPDLIRMPENFNDTFDWALSGSIVTGQNLFDGTLVGLGEGTGWSGQFSGSFFGSGNISLPEEIGGLWNATDANGHVAGGAFVGKND